MNLATFLAILLGIGLITVLITLFIGLIGMAKGKKFNEKHGNTMMRLRVAAQLFTLVIFIILVLVLRA